MPTYRRGVAAVESAAERRGGGNFRPFEPTVKWSDGDKKYILILTPSDEIARFDLHEWIPVGKGEKANGETFQRWASFVSRKDPFVGEDYDELSDRLGNETKDRCIGVAVELAPVMENRKGRQIPKGFTVKTSTYTRKTEDGTEEVTEPVIGLIVQSSFLMWSPLIAFDQAQGPFIDLPIEVTRAGVDPTRYNFVPFMDMPVDLSPVVEHLDGISYLRNDLEDLTTALEADDNDAARAERIGMALLDRWITEMADKERYDELVGPITELPPSKYKKKEKGKEKSSNGAGRTPRAARPSPRPEAVAEVAEAPADDAAERFARLKARVEKA